MPVQCVYCDKFLSTWFNLNKHYRNVHAVNPPLKGFKKQLFNFKCMESNCNYSFRYNIDLINHLREIHNLNIESENKCFANIKEFKIWKEYIEKEENCYYVMPRGRKVLSDSTQIKYFVCNRSGKFKTKVTDNNNRKRKLKSKGSNKIQHSCISQMILKIKEDNSIMMDRWKTHYGHSPDVEHLRISEKEQLTIASKLINGVSKSKILDTIRQSINSDKLKRIDILNQKDIANIKKRFRIDLDAIRHKDDEASIDLWVQDLRNCEESPVLFYKKQGEVSDTFDKNDFCLILMTTFQKEMITLFGNNIVYIDGKDGINNFNFDMFSLSVIDEYGEGCPVAIMFTNQKDSYGQSIFFQCVKETVGVLSPRMFMSDFPNMFYDAWQLIMGPVEYHNYCSWYVDQAWQQNMQKITNKEKRNTVYKTLKVLQHISDIPQFHKQLDIFINELLLDPSTKIFGNYFFNNYSNNCQQWAYCYCKNCGFNTDMNLESTYELIKCFERMKVKRLDKRLHMVLKFIRDKAVDHIIKNPNEASKVGLAEILKRHQTALISYYIVSRINSISWTVQTEANKYVVAKVLESKCCNFHCDSCEICVHMYTCTCVNFFLKPIICEHIHFIELECTNDDDVSSSFLHVVNNKGPIPFELTESVILMENVEVVIADAPDYLQVKN